MSFIIDQQTLEDLNIPGIHRNSSIAWLFNKTITAGGNRLMQEMFSKPLNDEQLINQRMEIFRYFTAKGLSLPFSAEAFDVFDNYLRSATETNLISLVSDHAAKKVLSIIAADKSYPSLKNEVMISVKLLDSFYEFICSMDTHQNPYSEELSEIKRIFEHPKFSRRIGQDMEDLDYLTLIRYDYLLRHTLVKQMSFLTKLIFKLDVYLAVARVAHQRGFVYAEALAADKDCFIVEDLCHPSMEGGRGNAITLTHQQNALFLTGANMAGKSTLMKAIGISLYLAHMGFPVAASSMKFSVKDGLYTSINVPDNIGMGYSHFYAEVLRVKKVAEQVAAGKNLMAIFDELFKGTNVKDAFDATLSITEAFCEIRTCFFVISTHILEVGEQLAGSCPNLHLSFLPTIMDGQTPRYTYQLQPGISNDRQGMMIIRNEGILSLLHPSVSTDSTNF